MPTKLSKTALSGYIEELVKKEITNMDNWDDAESLSNKRRKEFKKQFKLHEADIAPPNPETSYAGADPNKKKTNPNPVGAPTQPSGTIPTSGTAGTAPVAGSTQPVGMNNAPPGQEPGQQTQDIGAAVNQDQQGQKDQENQGDKSPVEDITSMAQDLSKKTSSIPTVLKAVKQSLQTNYSSITPDVQDEIIKSLNDTGNITLQGVSTRLAQFLKNSGGV